MCSCKPAYKKNKYAMYDCAYLHARECNCVYTTTPYRTHND